jgi:hypothetical protein
VDVVDSQDRASYRRVIAFGDAVGESATAEPRVVVEAGELISYRVRVTDAGAVTDLLFELHLPDADVASAAGMAAAASANEVVAGCDCFFWDAARRVLLVGAGGGANFVVP